MTDSSDADSRYQLRRERLRHAIGAHADALVVTSPANVRYLTGFTGSNGRVLVTGNPDGDVLLTDRRYTLRAAAEAPGIAVDVHGDLVAATAERSIATLGVEATHVSWQTARILEQRLGETQVQLVACTGLVETLRQSKDDGEIDALREACAITSSAMRWLVEQVLRPGVTERQLAASIEARFVQLGAQGAAFPTIVAAGRNGASPHHDTSDTAIQRGELVTIDAGACVDGYHADCTRTVAVGEPDEALRAIHDVVREAQAAGCGHAGVGVAACEVDAAARDVIVAAGWGEQFVHPTGHGVGLEVHEAPRIASDETASLPAGAVFTVEPGVYVPGLGGVRIEDTLVVSDGASRILTDLPRDLIVV